MRYLNKILLACIMALANVNCENTWEVKDVNTETGAIELISPMVFKYNSFRDLPTTKPTDTVWTYTKGKTIFHFAARNDSTIYSTDRTFTAKLSEIDIDTDLDEFGANAIAKDVVTLITRYCRNAPRIKGMIQRFIETLDQYAKTNPDKAGAVQLIIKGVNTAKAKTTTFKEDTDTSGSVMAIGG